MKKGVSRQKKYQRILWKPPRYFLSIYSIYLSIVFFVFLSNVLELFIHIPTIKYFLRT